MPVKCPTVIMNPPKHESLDPNPSEHKSKLICARQCLVRSHGSAMHLVADSSVNGMFVAKH